MRSRFWLLRSPPRQRLGEDGPDTKYERIVCPVDDGHSRGGGRVGDLSVVIQPSGIRDFTWTWLSDLLISQAVLSLFEEHRVTGFETKRARVSYPKAVAGRPPDLFELVVTGWGGVAAGVRLDFSCPACGHKHYIMVEPSRVIDPAAWDGSDLFMIWPLPRYRFVSERLADILRQEKISGVNLIPAEDLPVDGGSGLSPGLLEVHMPAKRARQLRERFGI